MFLNEEDKEFVNNELQDLQKAVKLVLFTQQFECQYCRETRELLEELVALSEQLSLAVYNLETDKDMAAQYEVDKIPAIVLVDESGQDTRIRFFGIPSGYEFTSLLEDIMDISKSQHGFTKDQLSKIKNIDKDVHLQVFVTPTCPYCPSAVRTAHRLTMANKNITADMVEATEFPQLAQKYSVRGVPRTIINEKHSLEGSVPDEMVIDKIIKSLTD